MIERTASTAFLDPLHDHILSILNLSTTNIFIFKLKENLFAFVEFMTLQW